jgi:hypothetical protein
MSSGTALSARFGQQRAASRDERGRQRPEQLLEPERRLSLTRHKRAVDGRSRTSSRQIASC